MGRAACWVGLADRGKDFPDVVAEFGWRPSGVINQFITGIGGPSDLASFRVEPEGMVKEARFNLTEVLRDDEHEDVINDWFVHYVGIGVQSFGEPSDMVPGRGKRAWWVRANGAVIMLSGGSPAISLRVISPQGVEYM